ncbi:MAG TPA: aminodeoxychorismate synthase component I [Solirubrobacterales bacterium]|nr:aminodeoxychorismate synthase component I [Solirubrobacterales bacterium]
MKTLLIDNYDSFTYNLFQLLAEVNGEEPLVVSNDEAGWYELVRLDYDNIVISPGPGQPHRGRDFGICSLVIRETRRPLLGVCLGHQGIGGAHRANVVPAPEPMHGRISTVRHDGSPLFAGIPREFAAVRYHSLCVAQPLPNELRGTAWTSDGVLMALEHRARPLWGVQFHPESVCTEHGRRLLGNFRDLTAMRGDRQGHPRPDKTRSNETAFLSIRRFEGVPAGPSPKLLVRRLDELVDPEQAFVSLYGESENAFWLDSSRKAESGRFSFMGDDSGPLGKTIVHRVGEGASIFKRLAQELESLKAAALPELPFEFQCGFAGWLGYELKAECGGDAAHESPLPDAAFVFADRMIAFDHAERRTYLLGLAERGGEPEARRWLETTARRLESVSHADREVPFSPDATERNQATGELRPERPRERYLDEIEECKQLLAEGETYEVCLTNAMLNEFGGGDGAAGAPDPLDLYRALRRANPAPYSAYLRFGDAAVLSSSPERFLRIGRDGWAEAKPIKGTSRRGDTAAEDARLAERLRTDEKSRAENLMIADLLRNDLGSVCEVGTVHVPSLMEVESYETLHQLVTTVRGRLREGLGPLDCVRACFPPGSMTGAPKRRTMQIIDRLEGEARGPYSGAIGWLGPGGACDLSVAIRTIVLEGERARIGAGGAIVALSDPEQEYEEMLLKASAAAAALGYSRTRLGESISRVTPRKSIVSGAASTTPP